MPRKLVTTPPKKASKPRVSDVKAKKLCAAFVKALRLKRGWDDLLDAERDAWRAVALVQ